MSLLWHSVSLKYLQCTVYVNAQQWLTCSLRSLSKKLLLATAWQKSWSERNCHWMSHMCNRPLEGLVLLNKKEILDIVRRECIEDFHEKDWTWSDKANEARPHQQISIFFAYLYLFERLRNMIQWTTLSIDTKSWERKKAVAYWQLF